jgi:hypothetical protein
MLCTAERRKFGFQLRHFRAIDELTVGEDAPDGVIDGFAEPPALRTDIDEWHGVAAEMLVHGALQGLRIGHQSTMDFDWIMRRFCLSVIFSEDRLPLFRIML